MNGHAPARHDTLFLETRMALIRFETNTSITEDRVRTITQNLTLAVARVTGEQERDIRVELASNRRMRMADSDEPIAHVEVRGVEFPKDRARELTQAVCPVLENALSISGDKVYIAVISNRNSMWRVNGAM